MATSPQLIVHTFVCGSCKHVYVCPLCICGRMHACQHVHMLVCVYGGGQGGACDVSTRDACICGACLHVVCASVCACVHTHLFASVPMSCCDKGTQRTSSASVSAYLHRTPGCARPAGCQSQSKSRLPSRYHSASWTRTQRRHVLHSAGTGGHIRVGLLTGMPMHPHRSPPNPTNLGRASARSTHIAPEPRDLGHWNRSRLLGSACPRSLWALSTR